jgi:hypothetical protein
MKKLLTIIMLCGVCYGYAQDTPPYAASTKTWVVEGDDGVTRIWSDYINMPECNKEGDKNDPCHRGQGIFYSYNEKYIKKRKKEMCPLPWRIPTTKDYDIVEGSYHQRVRIDFDNYYLLNIYSSTLKIEDIRICECYLDPCPRQGGFNLPCIKCRPWCKGLQLVRCIR